MADTPYTYPFDPTGTASSNLIIGERQTISPPNWKDFYFVIPQATPYFHNSLQVTHHPSGRILTEGVDYTCSHRFHDASLAIGKPIYGSITLYDKTLSGVLEFKYQTVGGAWTIDKTKILEILADAALDPRITTWEEVVDLPFEFPVIDHQWDLVDLVGASELEEVLQDIKQAIIDSGSGGLAEHLADFNNPHRVTKAQVALGKVENYAIADLAEAQAGTNNASYMTPLRTAQAITKQALNPLNAHIDNYDNPHGVTATQIGLGKVENHDLATQAQAEAGTVNTAYMTPLRTSQAITKQALAPLGDHLADHQNPHAVTKAQVGLSAVENFGVASNSDALSGTSTSLYMTPASTRAAIAAISGGDIADHVNNFNNPHQVTASQVGLGDVKNYGIATTAQAQAGTATDKYMTPATTASAINELAMDPLHDHINDADNPHQVTAEQVGLGNVENFPVADQAAAEAGTNTTSYMTPKRTAEAIAALANAEFHDHVNDTDNPHQVTKAQVGLGDVENYPIASTGDAQAGTSNELYMTPVSTTAAIVNAAVNPLNEHLSDHDNPHQVTAAQVGAYSIEEADQALSDGLDTKLDKGAKAADSDMLAGKSYQDIMDTVMAVAGNIPAAARYVYEAINPETDPDTDETYYDSDTWTLLGEVVPDANKTLTNPINDVIFWLAGGGERTDITDAVFKVHFSIRDNDYFKVEQYAGGPSKLKFGYTYDSDADKYRLWLYAPPLRNEATVLAETNPYMFFTTTDRVAVEEPTGIVWANVKQHGVTRAIPSTGEVAYGPSVAATATNGLPLVQTGLPLELINVLSHGDDETAAQASAADIADAYHDFERLSAYGAEARFAYDRGGWSSDSANQLLKNDSGNKDLQSLLTPQAVSDYSFEVEIESTSTDAADDGALGVCAAYLEEGDKAFGIYALRTAGGLVMSSQAGELADGTYHKLQTVSLNAFQFGAKDLGSTSEGLTWGDGVTDANRDSTAYVPKAWSTLGKFKLKVTVSAGKITIETTDLGGTSYVADAKVEFTLDASDPYLGRFAKALGPTGHGVRWGLAVFKQPKASFKLLAYPDQYHRYVVQGATSDDASTLKVYNGASWNTSSGNFYLNPGRFYYSELTHQLYFVRRDGTLKPIQLEIYTSSTQTVLTT